MVNTVLAVLEEHKGGRLTGEKRSRGEPSSAQVATESDKEWADGVEKTLAGDPRRAANVVSHEELDSEEGDCGEDD
eukprot:1059530-Prymnesium_polylepis.1